MQFTKEQIEWAINRNDYFAVSMTGLDQLEYNFGDLDYDGYYLRLLLKSAGSM